MQIKKFIELDFLSIDNQSISKVSEKASIGSKINLSGLIDAEVEDLPEDIEIEIKKQTKDFIVINKAPGIVVHPKAQEIDQEQFSTVYYLTFQSWQIFQELE